MRMQDSSRRLRGGGGAGGGGLARGGGGTWADKAVDADKPRTQYDKLKC
jgi:hypothetical protein